MLNGKIIVLGSKGNVAESMKEEKERLETLVYTRASLSNSTSYKGVALATAASRVARLL